MFGAEDAINNRKYSSTVRCVSSTGIVLRVKKNDFVQKFGNFHDTWNGIMELAKTKDEEFIQKLFFDRWLVKS